MPSGKMRSIDPTRFAMQPRADVPRSAFDVQHYHKTSFNASQLIPIYVSEILPGDSIRLRMSAFARLATALVPPMDNLTLESWFFFVPNRLVWEHWENLMGEKASPSDTTQYLVPKVTLTAATHLLPGTLYDYFGITLNAAATVDVISLPFRAYNLIWNEWFRDQDLQTPLPVPVGDGPDTAANYLDPALRGKRPDYFTTARPWPEKTSNETAWSGFDPLGPGGNFVWRSGAAKGAAPVTGIGWGPSQAVTAGPTTMNTPGARQVPFTNWAANIYAQGSGAASVSTWPDVKVLVSDLRTAVLIQHMLEKDARGGTRYTEVIRQHFGVISPDARLQRPEFLGGGRSMVNIHPLAQTSASDLDGSTTLLGEQAGIGTAAVYDHGFSGSFVEHGYVIGLVNVRADITYQQGINRMWFRRSRFEFYWPGLNGLSEQAIQSREIYADGSTDDTTTFGYQERWSEYKWKPSRTSGHMRSSSATPLDYWHFGEEFGSRPFLNSTFIVDSSATSVERALQVASFASDQFLLDALFEERMVRAMPMYSLPGMGARL